jgi:predicted aspartyl protease
LAEMRGSVDGLGRPLLRININGRSDDILTTVDTGFNGELLMTELEAQRLGIIPLGVDGKVTLGDGTEVLARQAIATLIWFGHARHVKVQLTAPAKATESRHRHADDPIALIGTSLITPNILEINFGTRTVAILSNSL